MPAANAAWSMAPYRLRQAGPADRSFCDALTDRLLIGSQGTGRSDLELNHFARLCLDDAFINPAEPSLTLIAETADLQPLGFVHAISGLDQIADGPYAYISLLAVRAEAEGLGIADRLLEAAEDWARDNGFRRLALDVFHGNDRARQFYQRRGFLAETLHLTRCL
jgi:GNAT superfamily N-acetyltransferase